MFIGLTLVGILGATSASEVDRVRAHLLGAEEQLLARDVSGLRSEQRALREVNVERLRAYRTGGRFPKNRDFPGRRVPYFRDADGTLCAMAFLLWEAGEQALVEHVVATRNNATVHQLVAEPGLAQWLERNGLSVEEASRIQPTYERYDLTFVTPSYEVRVGACSPPVTITGTRYSYDTGADGPAYVSFTVKLQWPGLLHQTIQTYSDPNCSSASHQMEFTMWDGGGTFFFRPADEGALKLQLVGRFDGVYAEQRHTVFAPDGGYRVPHARSDLPAAATGCTSAPGLWMLPLGLVLIRPRRRLLPLN